MQRLTVGILLFLTMLVPTAAAQTPLHLGDDATGDARLQGQSHPDTWVDITNMFVHTEGEDLVFHLGLRGTTTEFGQYCFMAAFQLGKTEYVGLDCFEGVGYQNNNAISGANPPATSRGTNVPGTKVTFTADSAVIRIPIAGFGGKIGDVIEDIYGLTYNTRLLIVADTIPDEKSSAGAEVSLGSYVLGADFLGLPALPDVPDVQAPAVTFANVTGSFDQAFENATGVWQFNWTAPAPNGTLLATWNITAGQASINITTLANVTVYDGPLAGVGNTTVGWSNGQALVVRIVADQASGSFTAQAQEAVVGSPEAPAQVDNGTVEDAVKDTPVPWLAAPAALLWAVRRRRTT